MNRRDLLMGSVGALVGFKLPAPGETKTEHECLLWCVFEAAASGMDPSCLDRLDELEQRAVADGFTVVGRSFDFNKLAKVLAHKGGARKWADQECRDLYAWNSYEDSDRNRYNKSLHKRVGGVCGVWLEIA